MGKSPEKFEEWIPAARLAQELKLSEPALERLVARGYIRSRNRRVPRKKSLVVLHPADCRYLGSVVRNLALAPVVAWPIEPHLKHLDKAAA